MSTSSMIEFKGYDNYETACTIYRHHDGYIAGAGKDLMDFLAEIREAGKTDGNGLASAYVVWAITEREVQAEIVSSRLDHGVNFKYVVERVGNTGVEYKVTVTESNRHGVREYELTAELVAREVAAMEARIAAYEAECKARS